MNHVIGQSSSSGSRMTPDAGIALGLGLTNECNLACAFCYRDPTRADRLSLDQVKAVMECLPVRSVNLGTGENGMHPDFKAILAYLQTKPVKLTITSNGHSVAVLEDDDLRAFHDIEFSLDYATQAEQDAQRETFHKMADALDRGDREHAAALTTAYTRRYPGDHAGRFLFGLLRDEFADIVRLEPNAVMRLHVK